MVSHLSGDPETCSSSRESEGEKSEMETDVGCSRSLSDFINTDTIYVNEPCGEQKTEMPSHPIYDNTGC